LDCATKRPGCWDVSVVYKRAAYILGYVDSLNGRWLDGNALCRAPLRLRGAIMSGAVTNALRCLLLAAAAVGLSLTNAAHADLVLDGGAPDSAFIVLGEQGFVLGEQGFDALGLQKGNGNAVINPTAAEPAALSASGSAAVLGGLSSTLGCAAGAPAACGPSDTRPSAFLGLARSAVATPVPGAILLFGSVLLGGLGMSARKARRRNRGAVSLLA
jgi:hypothetical protein